MSANSGTIPHYFPPWMVDNFCYDHHCLKGLKRLSSPTVPHPTAGHILATEKNAQMIRVSVCSKLIPGSSDSLPGKADNAARRLCGFSQVLGTHEDD